MSGDDQTILRDAVKQYQLLHADLWDTWKALDAKAQGVAATAGVFIAGAFAFVRDADPTLSAAVKMLLVLLLVLLLLTVLFAVAVVWVRSAPHLPVAEIWKLSSRLVEADAQGDSADILLNHIRDEQDLWSVHVRDMSELLATKGRRLVRAHVALCVAGATAVLLTAIELLG